MKLALLLSLIFYTFSDIQAFSLMKTPSSRLNSFQNQAFITKKVTHQKSSLKMNFFEDAFRYFNGLKKEASAKHILIKVLNMFFKLNH